MRLLLLFLFLGLGLGAAFAESNGPVPADSPVVQSSASLADLGRLLDRRLALMPDVARHKWNSGAPIDDPERERRIIDGLKDQAVALGLPADFATRFFTAQIEAAKVIQREHFAAWRQAGVGRFENVPDLATDIRPRLDALTPKLLQALADNRQRLSRPGRPVGRGDFGVLAAERLSPAAVSMALEPLLQGMEP